MSKSIWDRLCKVVCEELGCVMGEVRDDASFRDDLHADSLDMVELVMAIEEEFGIDVPHGDEDIFQNQALTVGEVERYLKGRLADAS